MVKKRTPIRSTNSKSTRHLLDTMKSETRLLGLIQQHLLSRPDEDRDQEHLHPSEISKSDWCPRQSFYRMAGYPQGKAADKSYVLENIFEEGHAVHGKYQSRLWAMGVLRGIWQCKICMHRFEATSPKECPECELPTLVYKEVPLRDEKHLLIGHSDGDIAEGNDDIADDPLLEIKTIGIGTLRWENPALLAKHTHRVTVDDEEKTFIDYDALWRDIKQPFATHRKQGWLYCFMKGRKSIVYIYECKWNQQTKEFVVRYRPEYIEELLDECLDVKYALKTGTPPDRPGWAEVECKACTTCPFSETCWAIGSTHGERDDEETRDRAGRNGRRGPSSDGGRGSRPSSEAEVPGRGRDSVPADGRGRPGRQQPDGAVREADEVDGLPRRAGGGGRDRRTVHRVRRHDR